MERATEYIDQALMLGQLELSLLLAGDVEEAARIAEERRIATEQAWNARQDRDQETLGERLTQLLQLQELLTTEAKRLHGEIRASLVRSRKEMQRMNGYRNAVAHAL